MAYVMEPGQKGDLLRSSSGSPNAFPRWTARRSCLSPRSKPSWYLFIRTSSIDTMRLLVVCSLSIIFRVYMLVSRTDDFSDGFMHTIRAAAPKAMLSCTGEADASWQARRIRSQILWASSSVVLGKMMANSSPPQRVMISSCDKRP